MAHDAPLPPFKRRLNPMARLGAVVLLAMTAACLGTLPWTLSYYNEQYLPIHHRPPTLAVPQQESEAGAGEAPAWPKGSEPTATHAWFGTDNLGRSLLARCLLGGAISLAIGFSAAAISVVIGTIWGLVAGYAGGRVDSFLMRVVDILYGLPYILLVLLLVVAVDGLINRAETTELVAMEAAQKAGEPYAPPGWLTFVQNNGWIINLGSLLFAIGVVSWLTLARVVRGQVLSLKNQPFVEAARAAGCGSTRILLKHLLPNLLGPIIVYTTLTVPQAILQESFLSFLGIGVRPPLPSWGNLASEGLKELNPVQSHWWLLVCPSLLLGLTLLSLNFLGDGLRDKYDPRSK